MRKLSNIAIAKIFRDIAKKIEDGTCEADHETIEHLANQLIHIKLNAEQLTKYLHCSRFTITRMVADGRIPAPRKTLGGDKYWYQDEVDEHIAIYKEKYGL